MGIAEHLLTTGQRKLIYQLYLLGLLSVVFHLRFNKDTVASCIVPDVNAKGFDAYGIGLDKRNRTEDAKGLTTF